MRLIFNQLYVTKGYKKIGYIGAQMDSKMQSQQLSGWNRAMLAYNQSADQSITTPYVATMDFGRQAISEMLTRQPELEAVICSHEMIALGVIFECQRRLIQIPKMLAIACVEGTSNCDHIHPSLTSVRIDYSKWHEKQRKGYKNGLQMSIVTLLNVKKGLFSHINLKQDKVREI